MNVGDRKKEEFDLIYTEQLQLVFVLPLYPYIILEKPKTQVGLVILIRGYKTVWPLRIVAHDANNGT